MKELLQTFGYTLGIGVIVFFAVMIISRSGIGLAEKWKGSNTSNRLEEEANDVVESIGKTVGKTVNKVKDATDIVMDRKKERKETRDKAIEDGEFYNNADENEDNSDLYTDNIENEPIEKTEEIPMMDEYVVPTLAPTNNQRSIAVEDDNKTYEIQLGVVSDKNANIDNFKIIEDLGDIFAETIAPNKNRIVIGDFQGKRAASLILEKVKQRGLKDAFLVALNTANTTPSTTTSTPPQKNTPKPIPTPTVKDETGNFVVRLGVFSEPPTEKLTKLSTVGKIYLQAHPTNPNLNVVSLGIFNTKSQASEALSAAKKQSFKDAYIAAANNQLVDANAGKGLYYLPDEYTKTPANACVEQYVIQLSAAKRPNVGDFKALLNMGNLFTEYDPIKDVSKVFVGPFDNKTTASQALQKIKAKGFHQAFVVDRTKY